MGDSFTDMAKQRLYAMSLIDRTVSSIAFSDVFIS